ncbi:HNH endonuclease [Mycolicibacterium insubricum]|uniref:HNH endonuclease n=1 Tax=Mycolicibacterium insubricum TaxID=444597 RepID=A0A1X0D0S0_9MYCO|nr:HNH endonuclease [Mycolicibacterium insubricum]MCV7080696.1 HNH endonuclease [Mycolicibacterium insubricum]ORA65918.1 HNH endonuclease [Mycolicibacterium insubricum]BBZ66353.1 HNH endonuclease [Mycolicibacterium insubricum]
MSYTANDDPLLLGQRVLAVLDAGRRVATYKLATLRALIDQCVEHLPDEPDGTLVVPIPDLARRVLDVYWRQVRPFEGHELRQTTTEPARILAAVHRLQQSVGKPYMSVDFAAVRAPEDYRQAIEDITMCLAQQPLYRLQRLSGSSTSDPFLYDDSFLHSKISRKVLRDHDFSIELRPGVAQGLARLAALLKPALEIMWVDDVRRMNSFLEQDIPDVAGHLFGRERIALTTVREPFKEIYGPYCFYCESPLPRSNPIDHVLPWSLVGIDGLANLVLSCTRCNGDKSGSVPAVAIVDQVLGRDRAALEQIAVDLRWPTQYDRVVAAARGIFRSQPAGIPT